MDGDCTEKEVLTILIHCIHKHLVEYRQREGESIQRSLAVGDDEVEASRNMETDQQFSTGCPSRSNRTAGRQGWLRSRCVARREKREGEERGLCTALLA